MGWRKGEGFWDGLGWWLFAGRGLSAATALRCVFGREDGVCAAPCFGWVCLGYGGESVGWLAVRSSMGWRKGEGFWDGLGWWLFEGRGLSAATALRCVFGRDDGVCMAPVRIRLGSGSAAWRSLRASVRRSVPGRAIVEDGGLYGLFTGIAPSIGGAGPRTPGGGLICLPEACARPAGELCDFETGERTTLQQ